MLALFLAQFFNVDLTLAQQGFVRAVDAATVAGHQVADFLDGLRTGKPAAPTFRDALETNRICDAIIASGKSGNWVNL